MKIKQISSRVGLYSLAIVLSLAGCQDENVGPNEIELTEKSRPPPPPATYNKTFSVATQNSAWMIWEAVNGYEAEVMANHLKNVNADIVVMQEAWSPVALRQFRDFMKSKYPYHTYLDEADATWYEFFSARGHGNVIFSKYPIVSQSHHHFAGNNWGSAEKKVNKGYVHALIDLGNGRRTYVLGTHFKAGDGSDGDLTRRYEVRQLRDHISYNHNKNYPVIIAGDFNTPYKENSSGVPDSESSYLLNTLNVKSSFDLANAHWGTSNSNHNKLIDYILVKKEGHVLPNSNSTTYSVNQSPTYQSNKAHATVISQFTFTLADPCLNISCPSGWSCLSGTCVNAPPDPDDPIYY